MGCVIETSGVVKEYRRGAETVHALRGVDLVVGRGEFVSVMGPSGSGKSTLLHLLGGLDTPTEGTVKVDGTALQSLKDEKLSTFRRRKLGFVFQFFNLLPTLSAWENVALPGLLDGQRLSSLKPRALELLDLVRLDERVEHRPAQLSGGQLQRVAIARALMADPVLVLADEPTGNLDTETGAEILELFRTATRESGRTVVMVTHDAGAASIGDRVIRLVDGRVEDGLNTGLPVAP